MDSHLNELLSNAVKTGVKRNEIREIAKLKKNIKPKYALEPINYKYYCGITLLLAILFTAGLPKVAFKKPSTYFKTVLRDYVYNKDGNCLVNSGQLTFDLLRPVESCGMCRGINEVPIFYNMSKEYFMKHHAYTGVPALIKGGAKDWSALQVFSYKYFKGLYTKLVDIDEFDKQECQFFGYKTNLRTLRHVFEMSKRRAALKKDQWYIGWSNCIEKVQNVLREHYKRPDFLPDDSESSSLDWIFMGGSGTGALMHIDSVNRPSWQAMIAGKKTWTIEPPPECEFQCTRHLSATMEPGDVLVVDTNKWYHSTYIHPGNMSITIGSEYD